MQGLSIRLASTDELGWILPRNIHNISTSYVMLLLAVTAVDCFLKTNSPISYLFAALFRKK